jgi:hypothetical protein
VTPPDTREDRIHFKAIGESLRKIGRSEVACQTEQYV